jgi:predicted HicB family RNase H-like nuclease
MKEKFLCIRISENLHNQAKMEALRKKTSLTKWIQEMIEKELEKSKKTIK